METLREYLVDDAKALVLTVHGSGEHIGRYQHVANWLNTKQISMIGGDLPGLGTAKGIRGHIDDFDDYLNKIDQWLNYAKEKYPHTPVFLFGHSLGGLIVLRYLEELKNKSILNGAIVTSPAVSIGIEVPEWQLISAKILKKVWPTFRLKSGIQAYQVSRDPDVVKKYETDPLVYGKISIKWFFEFQEAIKEVWEKMDQLMGIEILFLQAGEDLLVNPEASSKFVEEAKNNQITYQLIPNLYHEIFNEPEKELHLDTMSKWIIQHT